MRHQLANRPNDLNGSDCKQLLRTLEVPGFRLYEAVWDAASVVPTRVDSWAMLGLTVEGGYQIEWGRTRLCCGPASLLFWVPEQAYCARISRAGSRCLMIGIDPAVLLRAADTLPDLGRLSASRRATPYWLAFQLHREFELGDDLSAASVESTIVALLAELSERPGLEARSAPPSWLERVREHIDDEFREHHTLERLAQAVGVHHVHLAREFRRRFGCTVGHYIRQRRIEVACHRLRASRDPLSEIAFDVGFADQSHFTNTFRQMVGMTPGDFRTRFVAHS